MKDQVVYLLYACYGKNESYREDVVFVSLDKDQAEKRKAMLEEAELKRKQADEPEKEYFETYCCHCSGYEDAACQLACTPDCPRKLIEGDVCLNRAYYDENDYSTFKIKEFELS